jgi:hypothetical protein
MMELILDDAGNGLQRIEISVDAFGQSIRDIEWQPRARQDLRRLGFLRMDYEHQQLSLNVPASEIDAFTRLRLGKPLEQIIAEGDAHDPPDPRPRREILIDQMWERVSRALPPLEREFLMAASMVVPFHIAMQALILSDKDPERCKTLLVQCVK